MAQRFGGKYSPTGGQPGERGQTAPGAPVRHPHESRTTWITLAASPLLISAFWQDPAGLVTNLAGFGLIAAAMWLTREGLKAEAAYDARRTARRPAFPRKIFGMAMTALGLGVASYEPGALAGAATLGVAGGILHFLCFGPDPMRDKGMEGIDPFQQDRVARVIAEGEKYLSAMKAAIARTGDRRLEARVAMFEATARELFSQVEQDPGDLSAARRYMGVYLMGARDATEKFADLYARTRDEKARQDYEALLCDLEGNFTARTRTLIESGRADLEIEIEVLRDRLAREGVRPAEPAPALGRDDDPFAGPIAGAPFDTQRNKVAK